MGKPIPEGTNKGLRRNCMLPHTLTPRGPLLAESPPKCPNTFTTERSCSHTHTWVLTDRLGGGIAVLGYSGFLYLGYLRCSVTRVHGFSVFYRSVLLLGCGTRTLGISDFRIHGSGTRIPGWSDTRLPYLPMLPRCVRVRLSLRKTSPARTKTHAYT